MNRTLLIGGGAATAIVVWCAVVAVSRGGKGLSVRRQPRPAFVPYIAMPFDPWDIETARAYGVVQ